ncbi:hypothetical protein EH244_01220 [Variovorax beijingensis]|uniref:Uncharacterized protein n=1 Tax=Variovorax beijingensis TaxID=2496117 RepID=A0A3P3F1T4_9BURK|nr:hypothetical protein EH244_01220 [Variovorax beijingensis]
MPAAKRRDADSRGRLSLLTFFGEAKKVSRPPGRDPAPEPKNAPLPCTRTRTRVFTDKLAPYPPQRWYFLQRDNRCKVRPDSPTGENR